jgi:hypothetical protein
VKQRTWKEAHTVGSAFQQVCKLQPAAITLIHVLADSTVDEDGHHMVAALQHIDAPGHLPIVVVAHPVGLRGRDVDTHRGVWQRVRMVSWQLLMAEPGQFDVHELVRASCSAKQRQKSHPAGMGSTAARPLVLEDIRAGKVC